MKLQDLPYRASVAMAPLFMLALVPLTAVLAEPIPRPLTQPRMQHQPRLLPSLGSPPVTEYDYIVVGAGTSGMTLAARLAENPDVTVAVLEAGIDYKSNILNQQLTVIPGADVIGVGSSQLDLPQYLIDWGFSTVPQDGAAGREVHFARGKCLGGSSARNFMLYQRPTTQSHQQWVQLTGDSSWSFDARLNDYKKTFGVTPPRQDLRQDIPAAQYQADAFSAAGPVQISFPNFAQPFSAFMSQSLNELGVSTIQGHNKGQINGVQYATCTIEGKGGQRSTSRAFFDAVQGKANIRVYQKALAKKVLFSTGGGAKPKANAVVFEDQSGLFGGLIGNEVTLKAKREVILSAGAFQSPQLLMLSGIGPRDQLQKFGIDVLVESPQVGQNMQDHIFFGPSYPIKVDTLTKLASDPVYLAAQFANFSVAQLGPLTNNVADMIAFERWSNSQLNAIGASALTSYPSDWPTVEYLSAPGYVGDFSNLFAQNAPKGLLGTRQFATVLVALVSPQSRGTVTLKSKNPKDLPLIDPRWLTDPTDQKVAIAAFKRTRALFASKAMAPALAGDEDEPGADVQTDEQILAWIQKSLMTVWHPASTARMGKNIRSAVLDSQFRVFGVDGLRVVDASSFASLLPGHPQSVCYMIAERAATLILGRT